MLYLDLFMPSSRNIYKKMAESLHGVNILSIFGHSF